MTAQNEANTPKGRSKCSAKRSAIIEASGQLFMEQGFEATTMDEVAKRAEVSKQTVYSHFQSKEALFGASITKKINEHELTEEFFAQEMPCKDLLLELAKHLNTLFTSDESIKMFRLCVSSAPDHPTLGQLFYENGPQNIQNLVANYLATQHQKGTLNISKPAIAAAQFSFMIKSEAHHMLLFNMTPPKSEDTEEYLQSCVNLFMCAYKAN